MEKQIQEADVETRARDAFRFLEEDFGARSAIERKSWRSQLSYVVGNTFVEIELDWREQAVFLLVGEAVEGKRPSGYDTDDSGRRVRWHLPAGLEEGGYAGSSKKLRKAEQRRRARTPGPQRMLDDIERHLIELRSVLPDLPRLIQQLQSG